VGALIGYHRGGWIGALGAWLGFTLPSVIILILLASNLDEINVWLGSGWIQGLKVVAVAVVLMAIKGMGQKLCQDFQTRVIAVSVSLFLIIFSLGWLQPIMILGSGVLGAFLFSNEKKDRISRNKFNVPRFAIAGLVLFSICVLIISLIPWQGEDALMASGLVKTGALVFGGGHVVLPLLENEMVGNNLMTQGEFLAGYGAAQAVPGPMFTLSAYLGAQLPMFGHSWVGGLIAVILIFLPGMLLLALGVPLWNAFKMNPRVNGGLKGANAAVVGLLIAAFVHLLRQGALSGTLDIVIACVFVALLLSKKLPIWIIVISGAIWGAVVH